MNVVKITRRNLRCCKLLPDCSRAIIYNNRINDKYIITECQGGIDEMTDEVWQPCKTCDAYYNNIDWKKYSQK